MSDVLTDAIYHFLVHRKVSSIIIVYLTYFLRQLLHYDPNAGQVSGISACFNSSGSHLLALRRRLPPVMYATQNENALCQFYHPNYYNSCTMKTCSFAGEDDEYILSGSDDFNLYMWRIPVDNCKYLFFTLIKTIKISLNFDHSWQ